MRNHFAIQALQQRWLRATVLGVASLCGVGALQADELLKRAQALRQEGATQEAFVLLDAQEASRAGDPAFDQALAEAAEAAGLYTRALMARERLLHSQPGNVRAQDEQARLLQALGDWNGLQALPLEVRLRSVAVDAALSVDQHLYSYDRTGHGGRSTIKGAFDLGWGHDSNVNAGLEPGETFPVLPGVPAWTLDPGAWGRSSGFLSAALTLQGRYVMTSQWSVVGGLRASGRHHSAGASMDEPSEADVHGGVSWRSNRNELILTGRGIHEARGGDKVRGAGGLQGEWIYRPDGLRQWGVFAQSMNLHYPGQSVRDVRRTVAGVTYALVARNASVLYLGIHAGEESPRKSGAADLGHRLTGARLGGHIALHPHWAVFGSIDTERRRYGAADPFFRLQRRDTQWRTALGLSWVPVPSWRITPQVEWVDVDSTVPIHPYQRRLISVTVRREF